jgi:hypothetical protein
MWRLPEDLSNAALRDRLLIPDDRRSSSDFPFATSVERDAPYLLSFACSFRQPLCRTKRFGPLQVQP